MIEKELKKIKESYDKIYNEYKNKSRSDSMPNSAFESEKAKLDIEMRNVFMNCFVELFSDYNQYFYVVNNNPTFNSKLLLENKKDNKEFYKELSETQIFEQFIQKLGKGEFVYFNFKIKQKNENNKAQIKKLDEEFKEKLEIKYNYIIRPEFCKFEKTSSTKTFESNLKSKFNNDVTLYNTQGISKENNRVSNTLHKLNDSIYNLNNIDIYLLPESKIKPKAPSQSGLNTIIQFFNKRCEESKVRVIPGIVDVKEMETYKENINDAISDFFKGEELNFKELITIMKYSFARDHFIEQLLSNATNFKPLEEGQYESLSKLIYQIFLLLLNETLRKDAIYEQAYKLLRITFLYGKDVKGSKITIFETIKKFFNKKVGLFQTLDFWKLFIDLISKSPKLEQNVYDNNIEFACYIMIQLSLEKLFINSTTKTLIELNGGDQASKDKLYKKVSYLISHEK